MILNWVSGIDKYSFFLMFLTPYQAAHPYWDNSPPYRGMLFFIPVKWAYGNWDIRLPSDYHPTYPTIEIKLKSRFYKRVF